MSFPRANSLTTGDRPRGRPKKRPVTVDSAALTGLIDQALPTSSDPLSEMPLSELLANVTAELPDQEQFGEESYPETARGSRSSSKVRFGRSKTPPSKKSKEKSLKEELEKKCLLGLYNEFFEPDNADKHSRPKIEFDETTPNSVIEREIVELQQIICRSSPTKTLTNLWISSLGALETSSNLLGLPLQGLSQVANTMAKNPETQSIFRDLLIKYPTMRDLIGFGNFPEIKLIMLTVATLDATMSINQSKHL